MWIIYLTEVILIPEQEWNLTCQIRPKGEHRGRECHYHDWKPGQRNQEHKNRTVIISTGRPIQNSISRKEILKR